MKKMYLKKIVTGMLVTTLAAMLAAPAAMAEEEKPSADLSVAAYSQYLWRGWATSKDSMVLQPSMTVAYKGVGFNIWGNLDTSQINLAGAEETSNLTETDFTLSYDGSYEKINYGLGLIYYAFDGAEDTKEVFVTATYDTFLSPTLSVYRDIDHFGGWYITAAVSHSVPLSEKYNLDLGAQVGYLKASEASSYADPDNANDSYDAFHDGLLSASIAIPLNEYMTLTPEVYYTFALSNDAQDRLKADNLGLIGENDDSFIYGGISFSMAF